MRCLEITWHNSPFRQKYEFSKFTSSSRQLAILHNFFNEEDFFVWLTKFDEKFPHILCVFTNFFVSKSFFMQKSRHSLLGSSSDKIFGTPKKFANSEAFLSIESQGLFKKIPHWYYPLVIFSNYFFLLGRNWIFLLFRTKIGQNQELTNKLFLDFFGFLWLKH